MAPGCGGCAGLRPAGRWTSPYDNAILTELAQTETDHVVPLNDAWISGADTWTPELRRTFANDTEHPQLLTCPWPATVPRAAGPGRVVARHQLPVHLCPLLDPDQGRLPPVGHPVRVLHPFRDPGHALLNRDRHPPPPGPSANTRSGCPWTTPSPARPSPRTTVPAARCPASVLSPAGRWSGGGCGLHPRGRSGADGVGDEVPLQTELLGGRGAQGDAGCDVSRGRGRRGDQRGRCGAGAAMAGTP
jgi:hypothetical protein